MKSSLAFLMFFSLCLIGCYWVVNSNHNPERLIIGDWGEMTWTYDKVDALDTSQTKYKALTEEMATNAHVKLQIHEYERWKFEPFGRLTLTQKGKIATTRWNISGRGNILHIQYPDNTTENYNIIELTEELLIVNYETDIEARGIAKLTFLKLKDPNARN